LTEEEYATIISSVDGGSDHVSPFRIFGQTGFSGKQDFLANREANR
jgi:hypothetical protein